MRCGGLILFIFGLGSAAQAAPMEMVSGLKFPSSQLEGDHAIATDAMRVPVDQLRGFRTLLRHATRSPNQEDAGSCLFMALTGAAEWWLGRQNLGRRWRPEGAIDLSERYVMNALTARNDDDENWRIDAILGLNDTQRAARNRDYRYTKGWYIDKGRHYIAAKKGDSGAQYGTPVNWVSRLADFQGPRVRLPEFSRKVLFADPAGDQWNVAVAPASLIGEVKAALRREKAPVLVIYNHYGYWHAVLVLGYDDRRSSHGCQFTEGLAPFLGQRADTWAKERETATDEDRVRVLDERIKRYRRLSRNLGKAYREGGGCSGRGVFYVRDSIYSDPDAPLYDYDPEKTGEESRLGYKVVLREYEWLRYTGNHAVQIFAQ